MIRRTADLERIGLSASREGEPTMPYPSSLDQAVHAPAAVDFGLLGPALSKLLDDANNALEFDRDAARCCLAQASALLRDRIVPGGRAEPRRTPYAARSGLAPWQVRRVRAHIEAHLDSPIRIADLAALSRLSASYFSVAFRRSFGVSLYQLLARLRVERARTMMLSTGQPLSQIALACGFCDQAHLSRQFRRVTGSTPLGWRREHGNDLDSELGSNLAA
ncbi:MAG TPA: AraC family transcriptional regulator [Acetobacteraceae bacterium]|jgi:AraC family transcriptional regulator|nr:AraC family transcriptional regulator [Acetobacteraceae bacterium]